MIMDDQLVHNAVNYASLQVSQLAPNFLTHEWFHSRIRMGLRTAGYCLLNMYLPSTQK
jgi:hypothetical protein